MDNLAKIRINLNLREFEIEGSENFINSHSEKIESFLELLKSTPPPQPTIVQQPLMMGTTQNPTPPPNNTNGIPENFGEYFHQFPNTLKDGDKILAAGHFAQISNPDGNFSTLDASKLLLDQGIKLSNPAMFIKNNIIAKRLIKLSKGKFKLSREGIEYLGQQKS